MEDQDIVAYKSSFIPNMNINLVFKENPNYGIIKEGRLSGFLIFQDMELLNVKEGKNVIYLLSYDINGVEGDIDNIVAHEFDYPIKD